MIKDLLSPNIKIRIKLFPITDMLTIFFVNKTTGEFLKLCFKIDPYTNRIHKFYIDSVYKNSYKTSYKSIIYKIINRNKHNRVEKHKQYKIRRVRNRC